MVTYLTHPQHQGIVLIWDLLLRVIFNQHNMLRHTVFAVSKTRNRKEKFLPQHAFNTLIYA